MLGQVPDVATDSINAEALELLTQALTTRAENRGRMVLLRSPRAGFGKTHLLMRLYQRVAHTHEFISLEPSKGKYLDAAEVLDAVLRRFSRVLPAGGGLTVLDLLARRIFALGLEPLVRSGEVPSQDRDGALQALQVRPIETFDFHNEDAVTARWAMANFGLLGPRLTAELAERTEAGFRPVAWWVELLFRYSSAPLDQTTRNSSLFETVFGSGNIETDMHEKLVTFLNLTGLVTSPVLVLDEVEGFSSNPEAALQVTTFLNALHQSCSKLALVISVNGDVWETAFLPRLPGGLKDRLSDIIIDLTPMTKEQAAELLADRAGENGEKILDTMDLDLGVIYARGLIRAASDTWTDLDLNKPEVVAEDETTPVADPVITAPISLATPPEEEVVAPAVIESPFTEAPPTDPLASTDPMAPTTDPLAPTTDPLAPTAPLTPPEVTSDLIAAAAAAAVVDMPEPITNVEQVITEPQQPVFEPQIFDPGEFQQAAPEVEQPAYHHQFESEPQPIKPQPRTIVSKVVEPVVEVFEPAPEPTLTPEPPLQEDSQPASPFTPVVENQPATEAVSPFTPAESQIQSPFSIDTEASPTSPFQVVEPEKEAPSPFAQPETPVPQPETPVQQPVAQPFAAVEPQRAAYTQQPHSVTSEDQEKVDDLLRQFRDRYGRDE